VVQGHEGDMCLSLDRYLGKKKKIKILDAGCGAGAAFQLLSKYGDTLELIFLKMR